ncbi:MULTISPECIES: MFS transporter [unclassified Kitasatospora]|uniref:MFS transporter n=1 Tax=unclassified Kitasatospora TaxID=2633591 RepID=UPI00070B3C85|nr:MULTISPECIES: MFS transporter [unclassified Kitasatospora]KQV19256.1 MFS transporter [Kitasatospora sp. Root107]KRB77532.1 MFS transporter [Kitasatospora sp. Root187]
MADPALLPLDRATSIAERMNALVPTRRHRLIVGTVGLALFFDLFEIFMSGVLGTVLTSRFDLTRTQTSGVLASVFVGMFIGVLVTGRLADRFGRRRVMLGAIGVYTVFSAVGAVSPDVSMVIGARLLAGLGIGPVLPLADSYLSDMLPARYRGRYTAWAYTIGFLGVPAVGLLARWVVPLSPLGLDGWRWLFLIGSAGGLVVLALRNNLLESPRWLASVGRTAEAEATLRELGDTSGPVTADPANPVDPDGVRAMTTAEALRALLRSSVYRRRMGMMTVFHLMQAFGGYGFGTMAPLVLSAKGYSIVHSLLFSAVTFLGYPLGSLLSLPLIERVERKYLIVAAALSMAASGLLFGSADSEVGIVLAGLCYTAVSNVFSNSYHVYQAEIFPTALRVTAVSWTYSLSRITTAAMPFLLVPVLDDFGSGVLFALVAVTLGIIALDIGLLGPATTGRALEDVNESFQHVPQPAE